MIFTMTHSVQYSYYNDFSYLSMTTVVQYVNLPFYLNIYYDHFEQYNTSHITDFYIIIIVTTQSPA